VNNPSEESPPTIRSELSYPNTMTRHWVFWPTTKGMAHSRFFSVMNPVPICCQVVPLSSEKKTLNFSASGGAAHSIVCVEPDTHVSAPFGDTTMVDISEPP